MKQCICKKECKVGIHIFRVDTIYYYRKYTIEFSPNEKFYMYETYMEDDFTNFEKFDFNQYFDDQTKLRKQKLEQLKLYEKR